MAKTCSRENGLVDLKRCPVREGIVFSNKGNWQYETTFTFAPGSSLSLTGSHSHNGLGAICSAMYIWPATLNGTPTYSCAHKTAAGAADRVFLNFVKVAEALATVGADESIGSVANRLLGAQYYAREV